MDLADRLPVSTEVMVKLELFQHTGTFKARDAMNSIMNLTPDQLARGVTAVSSGNHAIATAWAAAHVGVSAKILMPKTANSRRVEMARKYGAEIILADSHHAMFELDRELQQREGRSFVHPFEGPLTLQGSAGAGIEFTEQTAPVDIMILPVRGGGLCAGFSAAVRQIWPDTIVFGVEPAGANAMYRSFRSGRPERLDATSTIADSLAPPHVEPYTFARCRETVDDIVLVDDAQLRDAVLRIFHGLKLAVEPAAAATTAALVGPLRERCAGKRVGLIVCGANIDTETYSELLSQARREREGASQ